MIEAVPRVPNVTTSFNNTYKIKLIASLINYLHQVCISASISQWYEAVARGYFMTWPGLTTKQIKRYCTKKNKTAKGHMRLNTIKHPFDPTKTSEKT